jgi:hypothetical protein
VQFPAGNQLVFPSIGTTVTNPVQNSLESGRSSKVHEVMDNATGGENRAGVWRCHVTGGRQERDSGDDYGGERYNATPVLLGELGFHFFS